MIVCHVITLLYRGPSPVLDFGVYWGATASFTLFLLVFSTIYGIKLANNQIIPARELKRAGGFILAYFLLSFWVILFYPTFFGYPDINPLVGILTFQYIPEFIEFIPTFGFYIILIVALRRLITTVLRDNYYWFAFTIAVFFMANALFGLDWQFRLLNIIKAQLVGFNDWHTFGVLAYFPTFGLGLWWGYHWQSIKTAQLARRLGLFALVLLITLTYTGLSTWGRWPPTLSYQLYGIATFLLLIGLYDYIRKINALDVIVRHIGKHALIFYLMHIILLMPMFYLLNQPISDAFSIVAILVLLFVGIFVFTKLKNRG